MGQENDDQSQMDYGDEYGDDEDAEVENLSGDEIIESSEIAKNNDQLRKYVVRIKEVAAVVKDQVDQGHGNFQDKENANQREEWLEHFTDALYENEDFSQLSHDIMENIGERFDLVAAGDFERSSTNWPTLWYYEENDRDTFLKQVRWFSSNHAQQFGRLLTPMVDGVRVSGPFRPAVPSLRSDERRLVLLDGEGLGHSAKEATSISTKVTEKFPAADMILLVDTAQSPMQAASLELLRSVGSSGHGHKIAVAFTHFDQVKGDNLSSYGQKRDHVRGSIGNALASLRDSLGVPVAEILERRLESNDFYLSNLHKPTEKIRSGFVKDIGELMDRMQQSAVAPDPVDLAPIYNVARLELALRDATDGFKSLWHGRLGLGYHEGVRKEHWGRIKALCRRIANLWANEYDELKPVADFVRELQNSISFWLNSPTGWTKQPENEESQVAIDEIRREVYGRIHKLAEDRLIIPHIRGWRTAFAFSGTGSSNQRAREMSRIYDAAAPSITSTNDEQAQEFMEQVFQIVKEAIEESGGSLQGV